MRRNILLLTLALILPVLAHGQVQIIFPPGVGGGSGVSQIIAGTNISISPSGGTGAVTISATGGGGETSYFASPKTFGSSVTINGDGSGSDASLSVNALTVNQDGIHVNANGIGIVASGGFYGIDGESAGMAAIFGYAHGGTTRAGLFYRNAATSSVPIIEAHEFGSVTGDFFLLNASGGLVGNILDLQIAGVSLFTLDSTGTVHILSSDLSAFNPSLDVATLSGNTIEVLRSAPSAQSAIAFSSSPVPTPDLGVGGLIAYNSSVPRMDIQVSENRGVFSPNPTIRIDASGPSVALYPNKGDASAASVSVSTDIVTFANGNIEYTGTTPTIALVDGQCGSDATIVGNNNSGIINVGTTAGNCTLTFAGNWTNEPVCEIISYGLAFSATAPFINSVDQASMVILNADARQNAQIAYHCTGYR